MTVLLSMDSKEALFNFLKMVNPFSKELFNIRFLKIVLSL